MLLGVLSGDVQAGAQAVVFIDVTYLLMQSGAFVDPIKSHARRAR